MRTEISELKIYFNKDEIYNLAYHIAYNEPKCPIDRRCNQEYKQKLKLLLEGFNEILDADHERMEAQWLD